MRRMNRRTLAILQASLVVFLWSTSYVLIKIGLNDIPPLTFAGLRYGVASLALGLIFLGSSRRAELSRLTPADWLRLVSLGLLLYAATQGASFLALARLPAITVNLIWSFSSAAVALLGMGLLKERPARLQWVGLLLALLGAFAYFGPAQLVGAERLGVLIAVVGVAANSLAALLGRSVNRTASTSPVWVTFVSMVVGAFVLLSSGLLIEGVPSISRQGWAIILLLALVNTAFAFSLWNLTLRTLSAFESSVINGTMMIWIPILAIGFLGETMESGEILGILLAAVGTLLVQFRSQDPDPNSPGSQGQPDDR